jgi:hypothetical protein
MASVGYRPEPAIGHVIEILISWHLGHNPPVGVAIQFQ